ncbi:hypothetical protein PROFUN_03330 [Planoprotostelium fungivorum]|uniref:Amidase domain-containing protein n=1 Tax=Planoprotostelium fungivorum TaxID=1890364 RepID=A0A2P6NWW0_9EUKA|nr:hypothetical protein PROFUN_03330 [Planoprotostelium fungivorum]
MRIHSTQPILKKRAQQDEQIERAIAALSGRDASADEKILSASVEDLARMIRDRRATVAQVVGAFSERALKGHAEFNFLTEVMIAEAMKQAREMDENRPKKIPPLYGIPMSIKDNVDVKGFDTCYGFSSLTFKPAQQDAHIVQVLRSLGAIFIVKTNVPQTLMAFDSDNPVFGATSNPFNKKLIPGGSSGGEAAVLAYNGAAFGWGSDIGGSLRIPAGFCGNYALKPTHGRFPTVGCSPHSTRGQIAIVAVAGPMARSMKDLEYVTRIFLNVDISDMDPALQYSPYKDVKIHRKLRFGYYTDDGIVRSSPAVHRSIQETVDALRKEGHEVFPFQPPRMIDAVRIYFGIMGSDNLRTLTKHVAPDPYSAAVGGFVKLLRIPLIVRRIVGWIASYYQQDVVAAIVGTNSNCDVTQMWEIQDELRQYKLDFWEAWKAAASSDGTAMDGIIAPVQSIPPGAHGSTEKTGSAAVSTYLYNMLDYTAGVVPGSVVDPSKDKPADEKWFAGRSKGWLESIVYKYYDPVVQENAPLGIQVVGRMSEEEKVVDEALEKHGRKKALGPDGFLMVAYLTSSAEDRG